MGREAYVRICGSPGLKCPGRPGDSRRRQEYEQVTFTFCGYAFRPRKAFDRKRKEVYTGFMPAVDPGKLADVSRKVASWRLHRRTASTPHDLAEEVNPVLRGWLATSLRSTRAR
jgi:RNA-directed DNA polymerase